MIKQIAQQNNILQAFKNPFNDSFPSITNLNNNPQFNQLQIDQQQYPSQFTSLQTYENNRSIHQKIDQWLKSQENSQNINDFLYPQKTYIIQDDLKNKNLPHKQIKTAKNNYNTYINYPTKSSAKIALHKSDPWTRKYEVQLAKTTIPISLCIINIKLKQFTQLTSSKQIKPKQILQEILQTHKNSYSLQIDPIQNHYLESLKDIITNVAKLKFNSVNIDSNNNNNYNNINLSLHTSSPFLFDILLFQNYAVYLINNKQPKQSKQSKLTPQNKLYISQLSNHLQQILKFRFLFSQAKFQQICQWYNSLQTGKLKNTLKKLILNEIKQIKDLRSDQEQEITPLINMNLKEDTQETFKILNLAFQWKNQTQLLYNIIESLNKITYDFLTKQNIQNLYKLIFHSNPQTFGFQIRLSRTKIQKYTNIDQNYFINKRSIMLFFVKHYYTMKNLEKLQQLLNYFMCISDYANIQNIQNKILEITPPELYCLKNLEFFLCKKTLTISFDSFLHNTYSQNIKNYQFYPESQNLEKQKQITLTIMHQITKFMFEKNVQDLTDSPHALTYKNLVSQFNNYIQYSDVNVLLDQIYNFHLFSFDRFAQKNWSKDLSEFGEISQPVKAKNQNFIYLIRRPFILHNVLKDYFYFKLFSGSSSVLLLDDLKKIFKNLPAVAKYGSLFWMGLCMAVGEQSCSKQIINDHYLKIQNQNNNFSPDLISLLQISVKYNLTDTQFEKLRFQMLLRGILIFIDLHRSLLNKQYPQEKTFLLKALNQLIYPTMRQSITQMKMAPLRKKVIDKIQQVFKSEYQLYSAFDAPTDPQTQEMAYQIKVFLLTQSMCQDKKQKSVSIFVDLFQKFPLKMNLYFYYVKIKNQMNLQNKKITRKTMQDNLNIILTRNQQKHYKFLQNKLKVKAIFGQLCLMSPIQALHLQFMFKFTKKVYKIFQQKISNQMKFIINQAMYEFHQIVQGSTITDPQYIQGFVNKIMSSFTKQKTIESQKSRQDLANGLIADPFISFAILQALKHPQFDNLNIQDYRNLFSALYKVRNSKLCKTPKFLSAYESYLKLKISLQKDLIKSQKQLKRTLIKNSTQYQKTKKCQYQIEQKQQDKIIQEIKKKKESK